MTVLSPAQDTRQILDRLACPACGGGLEGHDLLLRCVVCGTTYPIVDGIPDLRPPFAGEKPELRDWTRHWSEEAQQSVSQRFFSWYRKVVFARTVAHFAHRYFPRHGVFLEAGSGTSETSMRIDKGDQRILVAADIVLPVLAKGHPVMDVRVCCDIFRLPFQDNSLDGMWNVGVMEHFLHDQIDQIMAELQRVLKVGAPVIMLWPATDSIPQKILRLLEKVINLRQTGERFQFHPDEISKLRSSEEGRRVLARNGFDPVEVDFGLKSLMAFKTVVGRKIAAAPI